MIIFIFFLICYLSTNRAQKMIDIEQNYTKSDTYNDDKENVAIMPNNQYYTCIRYLVIGKSDILSEEYDVLVFVNKYVETITIQKNIKMKLHHMHFHLQ